MCAFLYQNTNFVTQEFKYYEASRLFPQFKFGFDRVSIPIAFYRKWITIDIGRESSVSKEEGKKHHFYGQ